jgi:hypothetical protein
MNRFPLGRTVATPGALNLLGAHGIGPLQILDRHSSGDWGELDESDRLANEDALENVSAAVNMEQIGRFETGAKTKGAARENSAAPGAGQDSI